MGSKAADASGKYDPDPGEEDDADDETREDVVDYPPDPPLMEWLKGFVRTAQLALFLALVLAPILAGFFVPLGPPAYHVEIAAVNPVGTVEEAQDYADLSSASQDVFDRVYEDPDNAVDYRTGDPPGLLDDLPDQGDETTAVVVRDDVAFRITAENRGPPLRFPAILLGVVGSALAAIAGYFLTEWDPV